MSSTDSSVSEHDLELERIEQLIRSVREGNGDADAMGELLREFEGHLQRLASGQLDSTLRPKIGASDIVQQTMLEAQHDFGGFRGNTAPELAGWLRKILIHNLLNEYRAWRRTQKRDLDREVGLDVAPAPLADSGQSPSAVASRHENERRVHQALARLPEDYQQVVRLRHREHLPFAQVAEQMDRSEDAVRMLWQRALRRLAEELDRDS